MRERTVSLEYSRFNLKLDLVSAIKFCLDALYVLEILTNIVRNNAFLRNGFKPFKHFNIVPLPVYLFKMYNICFTTSLSFVGTPSIALPKNCVIVK